VGLLGLSGTRGVLTRFGYAHGRRTAESLRAAFPWDDESEWRRAGARLHMLKGLVDVEMTQPGWMTRRSRSSTPRGESPTRRSSTCSTWAKQTSLSAG
jgi:hypothetical protein